MGKIELTKVRKSFGDVHVIPGSTSDRRRRIRRLRRPVGLRQVDAAATDRRAGGYSSGTIEIDGKDATNLPPAKRGIAMVFQSYALYPHMTVRRTSPSAEDGRRWTRRRTSRWDRPPRC
jgi:multiple sugar transport system ATP-binding protein